MIWHFVEVWLMVVLTFVIGCLAGAHLYSLIAGSRLAIAQGIVADTVGDVVDRIKTRLGLGPAWRPVHLRGVDRPPPARRAADADERAAEARVEEPHQPAPHDAEVRPAKPARRRTIFRSTLAPRETTAPAPESRERVSPAEPAPPPPLAAMRPAGLSAPRGGVPDNLQRIKGIGKRNEQMLNSLGIFHFGQIAAWTPGEVMWIGQYLAFPERIGRDEWVGQATLLAMGSETGFQKAAERRRERRREQREFQVRMATASSAFEPAAPVGGETQGSVDEPEDTANPNDGDDSARDEEFLSHRDADEDEDEFSGDDETDAPR